MRIVILFVLPIIRRIAICWICVIDMVSLWKMKLLFVGNLLLIRMTECDKSFIVLPLCY